MSSLLIKLLVAWAALTTALEILAVRESGGAVERAFLDMTLGLVGFWLVLCGAITYFFRGRIRARVLRINLGWRVKFVLFCILLALIEEAITTSMTNLAPLFGAKLGEAYITASANYFDVILFHSVVVFMPMFIVWAWLLGRRAFSPNAVFILFGLTGTLSETISFGASPITLGFWVCVYGLMVYLPAYSLPEERGAAQPHLLDYPLAVVLPFAAAIPVAILVGIIHPTSIHF